MTDYYATLLCLSGNNRRQDSVAYIKQSLNTYKCISSIEAETWENVLTSRHADLAMDAFVYTFNKHITDCTESSTLKYNANQKNWSRG
jgi:hypothetical protein